MSVRRAKSLRTTIKVHPFPSRKGCPKASKPMISPSFSRIVRRGAEGDRKGAQGQGG
jgi:hypothetical protein